jgi:hypothetical protein
MLDDLARVIARLRSRRVLFATWDEEIWGSVLQSLKHILNEVININITLQRKGPNDIKRCLEQLTGAVAAYLATYEADYLRFMEGP